MVVRFDIVLQQRVEVMRRNYARDRRAQCIANKIEEMTVLDKLGKFGEKSAFFGIFDIFLKLCHAALAGELEDVAQ